jgi:hypothetical protein
MGETIVVTIETTIVGHRKSGLTGNHVAWMARVAAYPAAATHSKA